MRLLIAKILKTTWKLAKIRLSSSTNSWILPQICSLQAWLKCNPNNSSSFIVNWRFSFIQIRTGTRRQRMRSRSFKLLWRQPSLPWAPTPSERSVTQPSRRITKKEPGKQTHRISQGSAHSTNSEEQTSSRKKDTHSRTHAHILQSLEWDCTQEGRHETIKPL